ncbi:diacylglycerol/lipid kinase family protein [Catellatospora tritici]|uniref:diacylglycerol/lipid kinase family protein n=1 Tax=Catellatospora tritici TaxID=2851566 RepID=UPI001C2D8FC0|nr:diacylglycerol kinase family protein [Catellatospora tritici]MBV1848956.1 diacylglycerol kinase family lipid kinase [Catellatospora tritici]
MRGLLVVNPKATTTSARTRDVLADALRSRMDLTMGYTRRRGHGFDLARDAATTGVDVVVALGGDGTVNEVVNGLMAAERGEQTPALAVVPGGSTNVFVRALGLPRTPVDATAVILSALRAGRFRRVGLGRADDRYFTFCAGIGLDAAVVRRVEQARRKGRRSTPALYLRSTLGQYFFDPGRRKPGLTLTEPGEQAEAGLANVIVQNTAPWTYLGERPIHASARASFDTGLDVLALKALHLPSTLHTVTQMLSRQPEDLADRSDMDGDKVMIRHDLAEFEVHCDTPQAFQLDGDYLGEREKVKFTSVPEALRVIC